MMAAVAILKVRRGALAAAVVLATVGSALVACVFSTSAHSGSTEGTDRGPSALWGPAALDACSLLSLATISSVLNAPVIGRHATDDTGSGYCVWQVPSTFESVSLDIGGPNTAGNLAMEFGGPVHDLGGGAVEFDVAGRRGTVEVVKFGLAGDEAKLVAAGLASQLIAALSG
ncbi:MAG: hypothetical protein QOF67_1153 [Mycobacterium sp.]|jgi:hypothetical protein|nr:hypothetical protein [Mycobacterium sp.]